MIEIKSFLTAAALGFAFGAMSLPLPAPNTLSGILGVIGVFAGYKIWEIWG